MKPRGRILIRITSFLFLLIGFLSTVITLFPTLLAGLFTESATGNEKLGGIVITGMFFIYLIWSLFEFFVGIVGLANATKPQKAGKLVVLGTILIIFSFINCLWRFLGDGFNMNTISSILSGILLPILFVIGAKMNQKS